MALAYQYDANGYFAGEVEDYGLLPNNATYTAPKIKEGFIPRWNGKTWEQVQDHRGKEGYLAGQHHIIKHPGPLPQGWSDTPPPPRPEEKTAQIRAARSGLLAATDYLVMPDYPLSTTERTIVTTYRQALRDVTEQKGFPEHVTWPDKPEIPYRTGDEL